MPSLVLALILLSPTAMVGISDRQAARPTTRVVLLFGLAASLPAFLATWRAGSNLGIAAVADVGLKPIATAWAAQAGGWLLAQCLPLVIGVIIEGGANLRSTRLKERQAKIRAEWSEAE